MDLLDEISKSLTGVVGNVVIILLLTSSLPVDGITSEVVGYSCTGKMFANGSPYEDNRLHIFQQLTQISAVTRFKIYHYGEIPDTVFGLSQCAFGDTNDAREACYKCILEAEFSIMKMCPDARGAYVWMDNCFLRYENYNFTSALDQDREIRCKEVYDGLPDEYFDGDVLKLLFNLTYKMSLGFATGPSLNSYRSSYTVLTNKFVAYAWLRCSRDLSTNDCGRCLAEGIAYMESNCSGKTSAQMWSSSCTLCYTLSYPTNNGSPPERSSRPPLEGGGPTPPPPPPNISVDSVSPPARKITGAQEDSKRLVRILAIFGAALIALFVCCLAIIERKLLKNVFKRRLFGHSEHILRLDESEEASSASIPMGTANYSYELLKCATGNFRAKEKLGEGAFGSGTLPEGTQIAVKRLHVHSKQGQEQFVNEGNLISNVQHRNLVRLLGCSAEGPERLLVYEYLPNKSLDKILFIILLLPMPIAWRMPNFCNLQPGPIKKEYPWRSFVEDSCTDNCETLNWNRRKSILLGVARGLAYLHEESQLKIVHRDVKAGNILLDENFNAKISDFGLARLFPEQWSHVSTRVAGTFGYLSPEYALRGQLTEKADVFSFGVLVLEIVSGRQNFAVELSPDRQFLVEWAWKMYESGDAWQIIDPKLEEIGYSKEDVERVINVAFLCIQASPQLRPPMSQVVAMVTNTQLILPPQKPAFLDLINGEKNSSERLHDIFKGIARSPRSTQFSASGSSTLTRGAASSSISSEIVGFEPR
eukprot:Gb_13725 [translate_table: standard]